MKEGAQGVCMDFYRIERWLYTHHCRFLAKIVYYLIQLLFSCVIPPQCEIGGGSKIAHGVGIVIHHTATIGENTIICQNVTIGLPGVVIGDNVLIGAGAVILGPCRIGDNVKIGANTVVNFDVDNDKTVVGNKGHVVC